MTGKQFYYYLTNAAGEYYYVDTATGEVLTTTTKTPIKDAPKDWGVMGVQFGRDEELRGIFQGVSSSLKFRGDGKKILESIYYKNDKYPYNYAVNFEAFCQLVVEKRIDGAENTWNYEIWYNGKFDFSDLAQNEGEQGNFIDILVIESSLKQIFDANRGTEYEIPITGIPEEETILMDGVELPQEIEWQGGSIETTPAILGQGGGGAQCYIFPMGLINNPSLDYFRDLIYWQTTGYNISIIGGGSPNTEEAQFLSQTLLDFTGTITLNMRFSWVGNGVSNRVRVVLLKQDIATGAVSNAPDFSHTFYDSGVVPTTGDSVSFEDIHTLDFENTNYRYLIALVGSGATTSYTFTVFSSYMKITFKRALPNTTCKAISQYNYAKLLIEKAFEGQATLSSQYLGVGSASASELLYKYYDLYPRDVYMTCGDALRQLPDPVIKGSLESLIEDVKARYMCGVGIINGKFAIETLDYFFQKNVKIGTVRNTTTIKPRTAKSFIFNDIIVGYPEFKADDLNGRFEVNSTQKYKMGFKSINEGIDLTSPYKAAVYEIEYLRSEVFSSGNTKDNANDNSIYLLQTTVNTSNERILKKYTTGQIGGVPSPTTHYNIALSPRRSLLRHIPYLKSIMNIPDGLVDSSYSIAFIGGDRNTQLDTRINGAGVFTSEYGPLYPAEVPQVNSLPRLFLPLSVQFEALPQPELLQAIRNNPYGYLEVLNGDNTFGIFITDVEISGADLSACKFTGLLHPDSDTAQFVNQY